MKSICQTENWGLAYCNTRFLKVQSHGKSFPHEDVRVVTGLKRSLQFLQLPSAEIGSRATAFTRWVVQIGIYLYDMQQTKIINDYHRIILYKIISREPGLC